MPYFRRPSPPRHVDMGHAPDWVHPTGDRTRTCPACTRGRHDDCINDTLVDDAWTRRCHCVCMSGPDADGAPYCTRCEGLM